jgi:hypothetical protein
MLSIFRASYQDVNFEVLGVPITCLGPNINSKTFKVTPLNEGFRVLALLPWILLYEAVPWVKPRLVCIYYEAVYRPVSAVCEPD